MELLKQLMKEHKLTLKELADQSGIPFSTLSKWHRGYTTPNNTGLKKLADFFKVPPEILAQSFGKEYTEDLSEPNTTEMTVAEIESVERAIENNKKDVTELRETIDKKNETIDYLREKCRQLASREQYSKAAATSIEEVENLLGAELCTKNRTLILSLHLLCTVIERHLWK